MFRIYNQYGNQAVYKADILAKIKPNATKTWFCNFIKLTKAKSNSVIQLSRMQLTT